MTRVFNSTLIVVGILAILLIQFLVQQGTHQSIPQSNRFIRKTMRTKFKQPNLQFPSITNVADIGQIIPNTFNIIRFVLRPIFPWTTIQVYRDNTLLYTCRSVAEPSCIVSREATRLILETPQVQFFQYPTFNGRTELAYTRRVDTRFLWELNNLNTITVQDVNLTPTPSKFVVRPNFPWSTIQVCVDNNIIYTCEYRTSTSCAIQPIATRLILETPQEVFFEYSPVGSNWVFDSTNVFAPHRVQIGDLRLVDKMDLALQRLDINIPGSPEFITIGNNNISLRVDFTCHCWTEVTCRNTGGSPARLTVNQTEGIAQCGYERTAACPYCHLIHIDRIIAEDPPCQYAVVYQVAGVQRTYSSPFRLANGECTSQINVFHERPNVLSKIDTVRRSALS
jgi:hypothetical protein